MSYSHESVHALVARAAATRAGRRRIAPEPLSLKRAFDVAAALCLLLVLAPLFLPYCVAMIVARRPVFFAQVRIGRHGVPFRCYKFRTMVVNAEAVLEQVLRRDQAAREEWETCHKLRNDPRITAVGRFLRRTSLDELPQLWNVLRGEMSLVGPRPVVYEEIPRYGWRARHYLSARPGITGLWQISGRNETSYRRRVALDAWYVRNRTFALDCLVLLRTGSVVFTGSGAY